MCGINLILEKGQSKGRSALSAMTLKTAYRGTDHQQIVSLDLGEYQLHLGFNRLSLIDLNAEAHQPFFSSCGRYVLLFNGEIYNYLSLKKILLERGVILKTHSDTEVLMYWLITFGTKGLGQLNGMFALVWIDLQEEAIWLARDPKGMKPLFMAETADTLIVSSVLDGILASGLVRKQLNPKAIRHYLQFRYAQAPDTFFENINELVPGAIHGWKASKGWTKGAIPSANIEYPSKNLEEALSHAVLRHLQADVDGGIFLSGGVDSTLLLALAHQEGFSLPSFCIHTGQEQDVLYARLAAKRYGSELHETFFGYKDLEAWPEFMRQIDQPIADTAAWLTYKLSAEARKKVKFVLSGAGADELFAGYHRHQAFQWYLDNPQKVKWVYRLKGWLLKAAQFAGAEKKRLFTRLLYALDKDPQNTFLRFISLRVHHANISSMQEIPENWLIWALRHDQEHYLVGDVLAVSDRMSMHHALEMRMPYLDQEVVKWANGLSPKELLKHGRKTPINQLLCQLNGQEFTARGKYGFGLPMANWIRSGKMDSMLEILNDRDQTIYQFIAWQHTHQLLDRHRLGKEDLSAEIYAIVLLAHWLAMQA